MTNKYSHILTICDCERQLVSMFNQSDVVFGHGYEDAQSEAWALISFVLSLPVSERETYFNAKLSVQEIAQIFKLAQKRTLEKLPLAYITGEAWLCGFRFIVEKGTIVPRSLVAEPINNCLQPWLGEDFLCSNILELCCGGGSILIIAANAFVGAHIDGVDISPQAIKLAQQNIGEYQLENRISLYQGDLFKALPKNKQTIKYNLIISNPPYVKSAIMKTLPSEYLAEPKLALDGGIEGLDIVHLIMKDARKWLSPKGYLLLEIGGNAQEFLKTYPKTAPIFLNNSANEDCILLLSYKDLPR